jgi:DNA polymerase-1
MTNYIFADTETNGLHIITSKPFAYQIAHLKDTPVYLDVNEKTIKKFIEEISKPNTWLIGHNIKYDCHMFINAGVPIELFKNIHIIDTMFMARLAIDHQDQVGNPKFHKPPMNLALKKLAEKYLGVGSRDEELQLKEEFKRLNTKHKLEFKLFLADVLGKTPTTEQLNKYYNIKPADLIASEFVYDLTVVEQTKIWFDKYPRPTYKDIPDYILKPYGIKDIILTRALFLKFLDAIKSKKQLDVFVRESKAMYPLLLMEREGLVIDRETACEKYKELYHMRKVLNVIYAPVTLLKPGAKPIKEYFELTTPSHKLHEVIYDKATGMYLEYNKKDILVIEGEQINTRSTPQMMALYSYETGTSITKADKATREEILDMSPSAKKIQLLRPLDKIIDTYLYRLVNDTILINDEYRLYGTYNNLDDSYNSEDDKAGTVTGRLSSDLQQFPKEPLKADDGSEIVNIRKLFIKPKDAYAMMYFDMSQLELRLQTIWSAIIDGTPDIVMARGFGPYQCHEKLDTSGKSLGWFLNESPEIEWTPTDFHIKTAEEAFADLPDYEEQKKHYRTLGKRANFAIGYGASKWKLMESLKVTQDRAEKLIAGWKKAYVGLTHMDSYLWGATRVTEHQTNLFGRRYYTRDVHKLKNWLVQGSGGDLLKIFLARIVNFIDKYPHWKLMLTVHDEIDFVLLKEPTKEEVKELLSLMYYEAGGIEVTANAEITFTSWAEQSDFMV